jgi:hypothetical protein
VRSSETVFGENHIAPGGREARGRRARARVSLAGACLAVALLALEAWSSPGAATDRRLDELARHVVSGGPPKDGIPPIDEPKFVSAREAERFLHDEDVVFGVNREGLVRAYPQHVLVWHEVVNETSGGGPVSITYCPLTGSAIGFFGSLRGTSTTFGTSGKLLNSNLVMYDRQSDSEWPQILGAAITGPRKGTRLNGFPVVWTTWGRWKAAFPKTEVLSRSTGALRAYGTDPYGSYRRDGTYYQRGGPMFPVLSRDERLPDKHVVIGVEHGGHAAAVSKDTLRKNRLAVLKLGGHDVVVIYDEALDDALAYEAGGKRFSARDGEVVDASGATWDVWGTSSRGDQLEFVSSFDVMWFAWHAFHPDAEVVR